MNLTTDMGRKLAGLWPFSGKELRPNLTTCGLSQAYLHTKWHLYPSSRSATTDMVEIGVCHACPFILFFFWGAGSPSYTMWPGPTSMPSFILIHPAIWPQYTNFTDRTNRKVAQKPTFLFKNCSHVCISLCITAIHNTAQNSSDNFPFYPPDNHHISDDVHCRAKVMWKSFCGCSKDEDKVLRDSVLYHWTFCLELSPVSEGTDWIKVYRSTEHKRSFWRHSSQPITYNEETKPKTTSTTEGKDTKYKKQLSFNGLFSGTTSVSRHQKGTPFSALMKQEMMGWQWHQLDHTHLITQFLQARCSSSRQNVAKHWRQILQHKINIKKLNARFGCLVHTTSSLEMEHAYFYDRRSIRTRLWESAAI